MSTPVPGQVEGPESKRPQTYASHQQTGGTTGGHNTGVRRHVALDGGGPPVEIGHTIGAPPLATSAIARRIFGGNQETPGTPEEIDDTGNREGAQGIDWCAGGKHGPDIRP